MKFIFFILSGILISLWIYNIITLIVYNRKFEEIGLDNLDCVRFNYRNPIEDFVMIDENFIIGSSFNVFSLLHRFEYLDQNRYIEDGTMISFNINTNKLSELKINNFPKYVPFHPHGIDIFQDKYLFVINHAFSAINSQERVELFSINDSNENEISLDYIKSFLLPDEFFGTANAIAAISLSNFYISTSFPFRMPINLDENTSFNKLKYKFGAIFSIIFNLKLCGTYLYNEGKLSLIEGSKGIINNGIIYDEERKLIYSSQTVDKKILVFDIKEDFKKPKLIKIIKSDYAFDNLIFDKKNKKIYACIIGSVLDYQKAVNTFLKYSDFKYVDQYYGGYEIIDINNEDKIEIVHLSNKKLIGISSGIDVGSKQILSSSIEDGLLVCKKY